MVRVECPIPLVPHPCQWTGRPTLRWSTVWLGAPLPLLYSYYRDIVKTTILLTLATASLHQYVHAYYFGHHTRPPRSIYRFLARFGVGFAKVCSLPEILVHVHASFTLTTLLPVTSVP